MKKLFALVALVTLGLCMLGCEDSSNNDESSVGITSRTSVIIQFDIPSRYGDYTFGYMLSDGTYLHLGDVVVYSLRESRSGYDLVSKNDLKVGDNIEYYFIFEEVNWAETPLVVRPTTIYRR